MHGVFFMSETIDLPDLEDQTILLFESEEAATDFIFRKLVEAGRITSIEGKKDDAIWEAQQDFGGLEFFHAYKVDDRRGGA
jgi:hypothetical protein